LNLYGAGRCRLEIVGGKDQSLTGRDHDRNGKTLQEQAPHDAFLLEPRWAKLVNAGVYPLLPNCVQMEFAAFWAIWRKND
jgi:hypothetical protein